MLVLRQDEGEVSTLLGWYVRVNNTNAKETHSKGGPEAEHTRINTYIIT